MEWYSESHPRKKFKRECEDEQSINVEPKSLLYSFVEFAWDERDCQLYGCEDKEVLDYLIGLVLNMNEEFWLLPNKLDVLIGSTIRSTHSMNVDDNYFQQSIRGFNYERVYAKIAYDLRKVLPFLINCDDNVNYAEEDGRTILHVFLEGYLNITERLSQEKLSKMQSLIKELMRRGASVEMLDKHGKSPFHIAEMCGNKEILEVMIGCLDDANACWSTALHVIVDNCIDEEKAKHKSGYTDIVRRFVSKGADVNAKNINGVTAVHLAAEKFHVEMLKFFGNNGADFKLRSNEEETPLHCACKSSMRLRDASKTLETIEFLVSHGCNVEAVDKCGYTALHYAAELKGVEVVQRLIEFGASVDCQTEKISMTPLHLAAKADQLDVLEKLVEAGADVNAEAVDGATPIFMSALLGSFESVQYLIDRGADLYRRDKIEGFTLLHLAAASIYSKQRNKVNTPETDGQQVRKKMSALIEKGFDVDDSATCGVTPLQLAAVALNVDAVEILIEHGANVNFQSDKSKLTALHMASLVKNMEIVKLLIEAGAHVNCRGGIEHQTPLHFLLIRDIKWYVGRIDANAGECFRGLSSIGNMWPEYTDKLRFFSFDVMMTLITNGIDVNAKDAFGKTPLYLATLESHNRYSQVLLESGARVNVQDNEGQLPLSNALKNNKKYTLQDLLDFGADINDQDVSQQIMNSRNDLKKIAIEHAIKLKFLGWPIAKIYEAPTQQATFAGFNSQCLREIDNLKNYRIDDLSLYEFLRMNVKRQYSFVGQISNSYESLKKMFPLYFGIIRGTCREAVNRKSLLESARIAWTEVSKIDLPSVCVENILSHVNNRYLETLVASVKSDEQILTKNI